MAFMVMFRSGSLTMFAIKKQYVFINGHESKRNTIQYSVAQGPTFGALLFLNYLSDLVAVSKTTLSLLR